MLRVAEFVHLHVHTEYSLLDGMIRVEDLVERAEAYQMPAVAMTDHGNLFGTIAFYEECRKKALKPIVGCEVYVAPKSRFDRDEVGHHLVLLCKNYKGYQNLCKLVTAGYREGFYYKPRVDHELLDQCREGLIAMSACLKGEVPRALLEENHDKAKEAAGRFKEIFDNNRFFLELMENGLPDQRRVNRELIALGKKMGLPLVATNDCHYLAREMARAHEVHLCIQTGKVLTDEKRMKMTGDSFYFRSAGEMKELFAEIPEAISNTLEIAGRCNLELDFETKHFPRFPTPEGQSPEDLFIENARAGFTSRQEEIIVSDPRFPERTKEYRDRLEYESSVIQKMGFAGYFLIVADFVNWAKRQDIPVGPGRGSAAGSLVSYSLGITDINPLAYGLYFERFLNPERREMPDIDVDFCQDRREEVIRYVTEKYGGTEYVAQIITFGTMKARAAVRDVGRVLGWPIPEVDKIAKLIAGAKTLAEAYLQEPRLKELKDQDPKAAELLSLAESLEGMARHASTHAAGVVISDRPLIEYLPLYQDPKEKSGVVAQFDMENIPKVGLIKFDLLGLKTLTQIRHCLDMIKENRGPEQVPPIKKLQMNDPETFALLGRGDTNGVFQLESSGMKDILVRLAPNRFEEMIAVVALYRPGPMAEIHNYIERKHGRQKVEYPLPRMREILEETYGILLYQEQVMEIAVKLAGYSLAEADNLRKAMGKKKMEVMEAQKEKFLAGGKRSAIGEDKARKIFDDMAQFAHYGFNKSHAAVYAYIAYQTAYLKAHFPVEFMASLLTIELANTDDLVKYLKECEEKKLGVDPPHVNESGWEFQARGERVRIGLGAVKGVGRGAVEAILEARAEGGPFRSLFEFCERMDLRRVNRRSLEALIKAGGLDGLGPDRARMLAGLDAAMEAGQAAQREREAGQTNLFAMLGEGAKAEFIKEHYPEVAAWTSAELLAHEKSALGFYLTGHPLARFEETMRRFGITETTRVPFLPNDQEVLIGGVVTARKEIMTNKRGKKERMAFVTLADLKGEIEVVVFASLYRTAVKFLENEDLPIVIRGRAEVGEDKAKVLAGEVFPLEQASEKLSLTMHLTLRRPLIGPDQVRFLGQVLSAHKGRTKVVVHVVQAENTETLVSLPVDYRISPDQDLIQTLGETFGEEAVRLVPAL